MPSIFLFEIIALVVCLAAVTAFLIFYLGEYRRRDRMLNNPFGSLNPPEEGLNIVHRAIKRAQEIIGNAELESIKIEAENRLSARHTDGKLEQELSAQMAKAYNQYIAFLSELKEQNKQIEATNQEFVKTRVNEIFDRFEQNLASFLTSTEQKSVQSVELELRSARQLVETYKAQQMAIIEENIVSILERTLALVLAKKLPLRDQVDLVYEALDKAKVEKLVV